MKIKKRTLISIVLTIAVLVLSRSFWLIFKPISFNLSLEGNNDNINVMILLNKRNNNKFHKVKTENKTITLSKNTKLSLEVKNIVFPKRLRIDFNNLKSKNPIIVNNITYSKGGGNGKLSNLEKFSLQGGDLKIEKDRLIIYPKEENCKLLYDTKLNFSAPYDIEISLFIIILILSYMLSYKLTEYVVSFKTLKNKSRIEIIFLTAFFIILFLPMSHIDNSEVSQKENRTLYKFKPLINKNGKINYNFGKDIDLFFQDRFFLRKDLIKLHYNFYIINKNLRTKKVIKGKDNWLFHGIPSAINMYKKENLFSQDELKKAANLLSKYDEYCKKHNKKFYFYIAPSKSMVYSEFYNETIRPKKENSISLAYQLISYLKENTDVKVIYPREELIKNKDKGLLYWTTDTHWNEYGAYIGYKVLMDEINKDIKSSAKLNTLTVNKFVEVQEESGDMNNNLPKILRVKKFKTYTKPYVPKDKYYCQQTQDATDIQNCKGKLNDKTLLMFRDSFTINLIPYLASTYKQSKYIWQTDVDFNLMPSADYVIFEIVEVSLLRLIDIKENF